MNYDDETLMAYADGELDAAQSAEISAAIERDPELAQRVDRHRALRADVAGAFSSVLDEPVPERLVTSARGAAAAAPRAADARGRGQVVPFPGRSTRAPAPRWGVPQWAAMAASLFLGAFISFKVFSPGDALLATRDGGLVAHGALAAALEGQLASAQQASDPVLIGLTFRAQDGNYCRSFTLRAARTAGLACRIDGEWRIPVTASAEVTEGMRTAASPPAAVLQAIEARISGEALDAAGEDNARRGGWTPAKP
jgi:hypothetical protein